eukprot:1438375-Amphidinium_carterae.1
MLSMCLNNKTHGFVVFLEKNVTTTKSADRRMNTIRKKMTGHINDNVDGKRSTRMNGSTNHHEWIDILRERISFNVTENIVNGAALCEHIHVQLNAWIKISTSRSIPQQVDPNVVHGATSLGPKSNTHTQKKQGRNLQQKHGQKTRGGRKGEQTRR